MNGHNQQKDTIFVRQKFMIRFFALWNMGMNSSFVKLSAVFSIFYYHYILKLMIAIFARQTICSILAPILSITICYL